MILIIVVNLNHVADLTTKWRSDEATEDQNERARAGPLANMEAGCSVQGQNPRVGRIVPQREMPSTHVWQGVANHLWGRRP